MPQEPHFSAEERQAIVDHVCDQIVSQKRSVFKVIAEDKLGISYSLWTKWLRLYEANREQVAHAREAALETLIEEMIEIADGPGDHNEKRVKLLAREKAAQMLAPRRFAQQRVDVTTNGKDLPAPSATPMDRINAILLIAAQRRVNGPPIIEGEVITHDDVMS